jgi:hypothetical protein
MPVRHLIFSVVVAFLVAGVVFTGVPSVQAQGSSSVPACGIGLRLLVVSADGTEVALPAIESALRYLGTPYTLHVATEHPNGLTPESLVDGCRARYNGIILTTASLAYSPDGGATWASALTPAEFLALELYERAYGVRQVTWFTFPTPELGFQWGVGVDTTTSPVGIRLTPAGAAVFPYMNSGSPLAIGTGKKRQSVVLPVNPLEIRNAFTYLAMPIDLSTQSLLSDAAGHALVSVHTYPDGRQNLAMTFDSNPYLLHNHLFSYGVINWVTNGLFIGERKIYMSPQIDDLFIPDSRWTSATPCGTPVDATGVELRIAASDFNAVRAWQDARRRQVTTADIRLTMAFNGLGAENLREALTRAARSNEADFYWVSHTYDHENLDAVDPTRATWEIVENNRVAGELGLSRWSARNLVTPQVSGLTNPAFLQAAYAAGIRNLVSDTSRAGYSNPSPNAGLFNTIEPRLFMIPRRPNNMFFNVATPSDWTAEYNCMYEAYWLKKLSYEEILDFESQQLLTYMLQGDMDPWMFHQTNMKVHSSGRTLLTDLLDRTLTKYNGYFRLPVLSPPMHQVAALMKQRMDFDASQVSATRYPGSLSISAVRAAVVPITGAAIGGAEMYGGQAIGRVELQAGQTVSVPLP